MNLIILRTNLLDGLGSVERAISENTNLAILKNVLIKIQEGKINLISTNLELAIESAVSGKVIEKGEITVPFAIFNSIIRNLNTERVTLEEKNKKLVISADNYEASIHGQDPKEFPIIPSISNKDACLKINVGDFKDALGSVIIAAQYSDIRPEISGVYFHCFPGDGLTLAATDGFRLSERRIIQKQTESSAGDISIIVPLKTASELMRMFNNDEEMEMRVDPNQVLFNTQDKKIISRLIDGTFPDYQDVIPKQTPNEVLLDRDELINALKLASAFAGRANDVSMRVSDNKKFLEVYSADSVLGENCYRVPVKLRGDKFSMIFNWRYLLDGLKIYKNSEITLGVNSSDRPVVIRDQNEPRQVYVVMPIKS